MAVALQRLYQTTPQNKQVDVAMFGGIGALRQYFKDKGGAITYPFFGYMLTNVQRDTESFNPQVMRRYGIRAGLLPNGQMYKIYNLTPVIASFRIILFTQDNDDILEFISLWMSNDKLLNFIMETPDRAFSVAIRMIPGENIQVPDFAIEDVGPYLAQEIEVSIKTYTGYVSEVPTIIEASGSIFVAHKEKIDELKKAHVNLKYIGDENFFNIRVRDPNREL